MRDRFLGLAMLDPGLLGCLVDRSIQSSDRINRPPGFDSSDVHLIGEVKKLLLEKLWYYFLMKIDENAQSIKVQLRSWLQLTNEMQESHENWYLAVSEDKVPIAGVRSLYVDNLILGNGKSENFLTAPRISADWSVSRPRQ